MPLKAAPGDAEPGRGRSLLVEQGERQRGLLVRLGKHCGRGLLEDFAAEERGLTLRRIYVGNSNFDGAAVVLTGRQRLMDGLSVDGMKGWDCHPAGRTLLAPNTWCASCPGSRASTFTSG